jgi:hypothetical protein
MRGGAGGEGRLRRNPKVEGRGPNFEVPVPS